jgi:HlyD family secretion protein
MTNHAHRLKTQTLRSSMLLAALAAVTVTLSVTSQLSGAVVAPGVVAAENSSRRVQHQTGGIVAEILVGDGELVREGQLVLRLDATLARANLGVITSELGALMARRLRLRAELHHVDHIPPLDAVTDEGSDLSVIAKALAAEQRLMQSRRELREGQAAQLREKINQLGEEAAATMAQISASSLQRKIATSERVDLDDLLRRQLVTRNRASQIHRELARLEGVLGELNARLAQIKGKVSETELMILQIGSTHLAEVTRDLRDTDARIGELTERRAAAVDQLARVDIRAPINGHVHQLITRTRGGVLAAGETAMLIVPDRERLVIEARINPSDIDEVRHQQSARLRFSSLASATTPELSGKVLRLSADLSRDPHSGLAFYGVAIEVAEHELARLGPARLMPGMPVEAFIVTAQRSIASYLVRPLTNQFQRAMRES